MKKLIFTILIFVLSLTNCIVALASTQPKDNPIKFSITGGIELNQETQITFDKSKTITGTAPKGSTVSIYVYEKLPDKEEELKLIDNYSIVVGLTGYFSKTIDLSVGENVIIIDVLENKKVVSSFTTTIKRKKSEIKNELEDVLNRTRK